MIRAAAKKSRVWKCVIVPSYFAFSNLLIFAFLTYIMGLEAVLMYGGAIGLTLYALSAAWLVREIRQQKLGKKWALPINFILFGLALAFTIVSLTKNGYPTILLPISHVVCVFLACSWVTATALKQQPDTSPEV